MEGKDQIVFQIYLILGKGIFFWKIISKSRVFTKIKLWVKRAE